MPSRSNAITVTFWVFVFWLWLEATSPADAAAAADSTGRVASKRADCGGGARRHSPSA